MRLTLPPSTIEDTFLQTVLPGNSEKVQKLREDIKAMNTPANRRLSRTVLLCGESGVGKNYVARVMAGHAALILCRQGPDQEALMASWESAASDNLTEVLVPGIPTTVLEVELFGAKAGAYTDAKRDRTGAFEGESGFILLDEIGDCPVEVQTKLLHVMDTGRYRRLGDDQEYETGKRILLATNRDLPAMAAVGRFRQDLLWRLDTQLTLPALRDQPENIAGLIRTIHRRHAEGHENALVVLPCPGAADVNWAERYRWPGNIRQLDRAIVQFMIRGGRSSLKEIALEQERQFAAALPASESDSLPGDLRHLRPVGSLQAALRRATLDGRRQILSWYDSVQPDNHVLRQVFSKSKPRSVRAKLSQWRAAT